MNPAEDDIRRMAREKYRAARQCRRHKSRRKCQTYRLGCGKTMAKREAAQLLGVSLSTIFKRVARGVYRTKGKRLVSADVWVHHYRMQKGVAIGESHNFITSWSKTEKAQFVEAARRNFIKYTFGRI